jgi:plasmid replication initiation protein
MSVNRTPYGLEGKYAKFKDFRYVLDRAQADLTAHTGLTFSYTGVQQGRSYTQLRVRIMPNPTYTLPGKEPKHPKR